MSEPTSASTELAPRSGSAAVERATVRMGVVPTSIDEAWRLAQMFAEAEDMVPKQYRGKPKAIMVAMQYGAEVGLAPAQALQSIAVINGRPSMWGDRLLALIVASPLYVNHDEYFEVFSDVVTKEPDPNDPAKLVSKTVRVSERRAGLTVDDLKKDDTTAICTFVRRGKPEPVTRRFSVGQAKKANLLGKEGPWQQYPDRMLQLRARGFAARDTFPDVLSGIQPAEEMRDTPPDVDVINIPTVHRRSEQAAPASEAPPAAVPPPASSFTSPAEPYVTVGKVRALDRLLTDVSVVLDNGARIAINTASDDADVAIEELQKFVGTDHRVRFTCDQTVGGLWLRDFRLDE